MCKDRIQRLCSHWRVDVLRRKAPRLVQLSYRGLWSDWSHCFIQLCCLIFSSSYHVGSHEESSVCSVIAVNTGVVVNQVLRVLRVAHKVLELRDESVGVAEIMWTEISEEWLVLKVLRKVIERWMKRAEVETEFYWLQHRCWKRRRWADFLEDSYVRSRTNGLYAEWQFVCEKNCTASDWLPLTISTGCNSSIATSSLTNKHKIIRISNNTLLSERKDKLAGC